MFRNVIISSQYRISSFTGIFLILFALNLYSNEKSAPEEEKDYMTFNVHELDYLHDLKITSGSFLDLNLEKSAMSMSIIDKKMVTSSGARTLTELLEIYVPGFQYMFNKWNGTLWGMRGVAVDRNTKVIFLVNGHKMNTQARDGFTSELQLGLMGDIERIEVLRGPAGLVYGSGAISGIVNVVTKSPEKNSTEISVASAQHNSRSIEANASAVFSENQKIIISAGYRKADGIPIGQSRIYGKQSWPYPASLPDSILIKDGVPADGPYGRVDGNWKVGLQLNLADLSLYSRVTHQVEDASGWFIVDPWPDYIHTDSTASPRVIDNKTINYNDPFWSMVEAYNTNRRQYITDNILFDGSYKIALGNHEIKLNASYDLNQMEISAAKRPGFEFENVERKTVIVDETFGEKRFTAGALTLLNLKDGLQIAFGTEYRRDMIGNDFEGKNIKGENPIHRIVTEVNYNTFSIFTEGYYDLLSNLGVHLGARLDLHTRAKMFDGKCALVYSPNETNFLKLIYQSSSNNGSADNYEYNRFHFNPSDGTVRTQLAFERPYFVPSTDSDILPVYPSIDVLHELKPEKVYTWEYTSTHKIGNYLIVLPSVAYGKVVNLFGWSQSLFRVVNAGEYKYVNVDLDSRLKFKKISAGVNHTFQRPVQTSVKKQSEAFVQPKVDFSKPGWYDSVMTDRGWYYFPVASKTEVDTIRINLVSDAVTSDGDNFLNLATNVTKFYLSYFPFDWMAINANLRIFWGLPGRNMAYSNDEKTGFEYWNISNQDEFNINYYPKKLNANIQFFLPSNMTISLLAYDILGVNSKEADKQKRYRINTIRWQQMAQPEQKELYSNDFCSFGLSITKSF
jgi:outer membrane receptor protein involved in Fe transport